MKKFIQAINTGKGFITSDDQQIKGLTFECFDNIHEVVGEETEINIWKERVLGTELSEADYIYSKAEKEKVGIDNRLLETEAEKINLNDRLEIVNNILSLT
jgi:hypothetical protein